MFRHDLLSHDEDHFSLWGKQCYILELLEIKFYVQKFFLLQKNILD